MTRNVKGSKPRKSRKSDVPSIIAVYQNEIKFDVSQVNIKKPNLILLFFLIIFGNQFMNKIGYTHLLNISLKLISNNE